MEQEAAAAATTTTADSRELVARWNQNTKKAVLLYPTSGWCGIPKTISHVPYLSGAFILQPKGAHVSQ